MIDLGQPQRIGRLDVDGLLGVVIAVGDAGNAVEPDEPVGRARARHGDAEARQLIARCREMVLRVELEGADHLGALAVDADIELQIEGLRRRLSGGGRSGKDQTAEGDRTQPVNWRTGSSPLP